MIIYKLVPRFVRLRNLRLVLKLFSITNRPRKFRLYIYTGNSQKSLSFTFVTDKDPNFGILTIKVLNNEFAYVTTKSIHQSFHPIFNGKLSTCYCVYVRRMKTCIQVHINLSCSNYAKNKKKKIKEEKRRRVGEIIPSTLQPQREAVESGSVPLKQRWPPPPTSQRGRRTPPPHTSMKVALHPRRWGGFIPATLLFVTTKEKYYVHLRYYFKSISQDVIRDS